jgi:hypothetical protein
MGAQIGHIPRQMAAKLASYWVSSAPVKAYTYDICRNNTYLVLFSIISREYVGTMWFKDLRKWMKPL